MGSARCSAREARVFAGCLQQLERVGARRLRQAVPPRGALRVDHDEGLGDKTEDQVEDLDFREFGVRGEGIAPSPA